MQGGFFGQGGDGDGAQAEYVRVPQADGTLVKVPGSEFSAATMASLLALADVMSTGLHAAISAGVQPGQTVAVVGDGAVGLCGVLAANLLGAERIIMLASTHQDRHALAREWGATDIVTVRGDEAVDQLKGLTDGFGADAVLEPHNVEVDGETTLYRNIGMRGGPAPARAYQPDLLARVLDGSIEPGKVFDLVTDLDHIAEAYAAMDERRAIKALVKISELGASA